MLQSNKKGADILFANGASACTDVTGFGLLGHLVEMAKPSGVNVTLCLPDIPILEGAVDLIKEGIFSSLQPQNVRLRRAIKNVEKAAEDIRYPIIFDPQTSGGLLASVSHINADACVRALRTAGYRETAVIGEVTENDGTLEPVMLTTSI